MLEKLNIVRDCWWLMPSGDTYLMDENGQLSSQSHALYSSLNTNDNQYIRASNSGDMIYYGRLETTNINTTHLYATLRAECQPPGSAILSINNSFITAISVSGGINDYEQTVDLTTSNIKRIHYGRIDKNYDYFDLELSNPNPDSEGIRTPDLWMDAGSGIYKSVVPVGGTAPNKRYIGADPANYGDEVIGWQSRGTKHTNLATNTGCFIGKSGEAPIWTDNVFNGLPAIRFWGSPSGQHLTCYTPVDSKPLSSTSGTIYAVVIPHCGDDYVGVVYAQQKIINFTTYADTLFHFGIGRTKFNSVEHGRYPYTRTRTDNLTSIKSSYSPWYEAESGVPIVFGATQNIGKKIFTWWEINGSGARNVADTTNPQWIGKAINANLSSIGTAYTIDTFQEFDGFIFEIMGWDTPLSSGELVSLNRYMYNKYGLYGVYVPTQIKLYDFNIYYSGSNTWANHQTGLPNVTTETLLPNGLYYPPGAGWTGTISAINTSISDSGVDNGYLEYNGVNTYIKQNFSGNSVSSRDVTRYTGFFGAPMPSGYVGIDFTNDIDSFTKITRARMNLRMSLPIPSGHNNQDTIEINGYNARYKNQDNREELAYVNASQIPRHTSRGYFLYGAGPIIQQSGFQNYNIELSFINPDSPDGNYKSTYHANSDMLANIELQLIGVPSGTRISAAELQVDYMPDEFMSLYTIGATRIYRCPSSGVIDAGTLDSWSAGHGGWHHQGWRLCGPTVVEEDVFTNFYTFSEGRGHTRTYPETCKTYYFPPGDEDYTVYADYLTFAPYGTEGDEGDVTSLLKDPQRREYYRNPISARDLTPVYEQNLRDITAFKPHYYRHMIYHGSSLNYVDVELGDGDNTSLSTKNISQIFFEDRLGLLEDFTLYFAIYRDYGFQSYGRFFHRGLTEAEGITEYEIYGDLEPNLVRFTVQGANGTDNRVEVEINQWTKEPILIWFSCEYNVLGYTTMKLSVHQDTKNYFSRDWLHSETRFTGRRKQYSSNVEEIDRGGNTYEITWGGPRTVLGTLENLNVYEQMSRRLYLHHASFVEFGYKAGEAINLEYLTSYDSVKIRYDISPDKDKRFLSTRIANSQYLQHNPSGIRWIVPEGSGVALWRTRYNVFESWNPSNIYAIYNPVSTAGTNHIVHPSAVYVELDLAHSTDHPSGLTIHVDVEFDSGTSDNWKVAHTTLEGIPSGGGTWLQYAPIKYSTSTNKHINMDEDPIRWTDLQNINITLTTEYPGYGNESYQGSVEIRSLRVFFDSYCVAATGVNDFDLYTYGGAQTLEEPQLDLYILGNRDKSESLDLYINGVALQASGDITLYTHGIPSPFISPGDDHALSLYTYGVPYSSGVPINNLYTTLYIWSRDLADDGTGFEPGWALPLVLNGGASDSLGSGEVVTNTTLYIEGHIPSGITNQVNLYIQNNEEIATLYNYVYGKQTLASLPKYFIDKIDNSYIIDSTPNKFNGLITSDTTAYRAFHTDIPTGANGISMEQVDEYTRSYIGNRPWGQRDRAYCGWVKFVGMPLPNSVAFGSEYVIFSGLFTILFSSTDINVIARIGTTNYQINTAFASYVGDWHHIAATIDRSSYMQLYIDGDFIGQTVVSGTGATNIPYLSSLTNFNIGQDSFLASGSYYDVRMYECNLSQSDINNIMQFKPIEKQPLVNWLSNNPTSLNMYIYGSGAPPSQQLELFTSGY